MDKVATVVEFLGDLALIVVFTVITVRALKLMAGRFWYGLHAVSTFGIFVAAAVYVIERT